MIHLWKYDNLSFLLIPLFFLPSLHHKIRYYNLSCFSITMRLKHSNLQRQKCLICIHLCMIATAIDMVNVIYSYPQLKVSHDVEWRSVNCAFRHDAIMHEHLTYWQISYLLDDNPIWEKSYTAFITWRKNGKGEKNDGGELKCSATLHFLPHTLVELCRINKSWDSFRGRCQDCSWQYIGIVHFTAPYLYCADKNELSCKFNKVVYWIWRNILPCILLLI